MPHGHATSDATPRHSLVRGSKVTFEHMSDGTEQPPTWKGEAVRKLVAALMLSIAVFATGSAYAHAFLDHATPAVGSTVAALPQEISLSFTQNLEPSFSSVEVTGPNGARVDAGKAQISGNAMKVGLKAAGPGTYHVHWRALSVDTHTTQGSFTFHVGQ
jgi:copper resistance protein C